MTEYNYPQTGNRKWKAPVANAAALPATGNVTGDVRLALDSSILYTWTGAAWGGCAVAFSAGVISDTNSVDLTVAAGVLSAAVKRSSAAAGSGNMNVALGEETDGLHAQIAYATGSVPGAVSTAAQSFAGAKTFVDGIVVATTKEIDTSSSGVINIGTTNAGVVNIGRSGATINLIGDVLYETVTDLYVKDKCITLNDGGAVTSGMGCGIEIEENAAVTGYAKVSADRNSWVLKAPNTAGDVTLTPGASGITFDQSCATTSSPAFAAVTLDGVPIGSIQSAGVYSGCAVTDGGSGTVDVAAGVVVFKTTDSDVGAIKQLATPAATGVSLTDNSVNWIYANYNAGSPAIAVATDWTTINKHTQVILGCVHRIGTEVYLLNTSQVLPDFDRKEMQRLWEMRGVQRTSGAAIGQTGTRNITVSAGVFHSAVTRFATAAIDTSGAGTFTAVYRDGGTGWTEQASQTQLNNDKYDDGSGTLATLGANKYGVHWVYGAKLTGTTMALYVQYGQGNYSLAEANAAKAPAAYPPLSSVGVLLAKLIIQKSASSILTVENISDPTLIYAQSNDHEELAGLLGGAANDHYHLTAAQHTIATQAASASVSGYVSTSAQTFAGAKTFNAGIAISGGTTNNFLQLETGGTAASTKLTLSGTTWQFGLDTTVKSSITEAGAFSGVTGAFATSVTSPTIYGGTADGADLTLESTSGTKSGSLINFGASGAAGQIDRNLNTWTIGPTSGLVNAHILQADGLAGPMTGWTCQQIIKDTTAQAAGVGGGIALYGNYTDAGASTPLAFIKGYKYNGTSTDYKGGLRLGVRGGGGGSPDTTTGIDIAYTGAVTIGASTGSYLTHKLQSGDAVEVSIVSASTSKTTALRWYQGATARFQMGVEASITDFYIYSDQGAKYVANCSSAGAWSFPVQTTHTFGGTSAAANTYLDVKSDSSNRPYLRLYTGTANVSLSHGSSVDLELPTSKAYNVYQGSSVVQALSTSGATTLGASGTSSMHKIQSNRSDGIVLEVKNNYSTQDSVIRIDGTTAYCDVGISGGEAYFSNITAASGGSALYYNGSGQLTTTSSLRATKANWQDLNDVSWLLSVPCGSFNYKKKINGVWTEEVEEARVFGTYFEDMMEICPQVCFDFGIDQNGERNAGIDYTKFIIPILRLCQKQQELINQLKARIEALEKNK